MFPNVKTDLVVKDAKTCSWKPQFEPRSWQIDSCSTQPKFSFSTLYYTSQAKETKI